MVNQSISSIIIDKFGLNLYQRSVKFLTNKINIIEINEDPIIIRSLILDNDREFHLIVDEKKNEIFHDCPTFLIHQDKEKKVCIHLVKILLVIKSKIALKILNNFKSYILTSEDLGSKKKTNNFLLMANSCFKNNNCVEALNNLNKAIINQFESEPIIEIYLKTAIENNLFMEFFEFLKNGYENELEYYLTNFYQYIEKGFKKFLNTLSKYSFFNLLKIIESIDKMLEFIDIPFLAAYIDKFKKLVNSPNINDYYFAIYLIKKNHERLIELDPDFKDIIPKNKLEILKTKLIDYFYSEIENFCLIDKLKLLKKQFQVIDIPKDQFYPQYKKYKLEIQELGKKVYLKKFSYLKLLIEKYNIKKAYIDFKKKRNTYVVKHYEENLKNPVYHYIISRIGFFGPNEQIIKSSEIGINYFFMKELFLDDFSKFQDVFYYRQQFWGEIEEYDINSVNGLTLSSETKDYNYEIEHIFLDELLIIEWDLVNKPIQGSIVNAYSSQIMIPDYNNPLFHDLKPFDLCYCKKTPIKIESNIIKTINVLKKCTFKDAINSISKGMEFIQVYYPLSLVKSVLNREINPFDAYENVINNPDKIFIPNYDSFIRAFSEFLLNFILKEKEYIFDQLKNDTHINTNQILTLLNLNNEIAGLDLPFTEILERCIFPNITLKSLKSNFLNEIHKVIEITLKKKELGTTSIFDLKKIQHTPFFKYSNDILNIRKEEFESLKILRYHDNNEIFYDFSVIRKTYYGQKFMKILQIEDKSVIKSKMFDKFQQFSSKLNLKIQVEDMIGKV
ncbi:MAG: hypothetical protein ACFE9Z_16115 [Promethearchaeota archaeon]